jgi:hypothetical protein
VEVVEGSREIETKKAEIARLLRHLAFDGEQIVVTVWSEAVDEGNIGITWVENQRRGVAAAFLGKNVFGPRAKLAPLVCRKIEQIRPGVERRY